MGTLLVEATLVLLLKWGSTQKGTNLLSWKQFFSFILFNDLQRFLDEIKTDNLTVSDNEIIT